MRKLKILHPFLLAVYPIFFLLAHNQREILPTAAFKPVLISSSIVFALFLFLSFALKNAKKSALIVSLFLLFFFTYGHGKTIFPQDFNIDIANIKIGSDKLIFLLWGIIFITAGYVILRTKKNLSALTNTLNLIALFLVLFPLLNIVKYEIQTKRLLLNSKELRDLSAPSDNLTEKNLPDIYYLIFDRYAADSTLFNELGFDNSKFTDYLKNKGFYVAREARANYPKTFQSLASSLNMTHLTYLTKKVGKNSSDQTAASNMLKNHVVGDVLKKHGYTYYHIGPYWQPTRENKQADVNISWSYLDIDEFSSMLIKMTPIYPIIAKKKAIDYKDENALRVEQKLSIPFMVDNLKNIAKNKKSPKFVFVHFLLPHGPYVFDADGNNITEKRAIEIGEIKGYLGQVQFANKKIKEIIDWIFVNSKNKPIIIIQSDEGPCGFVKELSADDGWGKCGEKSDWTKLSTKTLQIKMRILNAYYFPKVNNIENTLYQDVTPVNTFRIIFNEYFGANYKLLPDKSYIFKDLKHPYDFVDVTDRISY